HNGVLYEKLLECQDKTTSFLSYPVCLFCIFVIFNLFEKQKPSIFLSEHQKKICKLPALRYIGGTGFGGEW
ncbi:MAG: hypothetical protein WHS88_00300, partial [Anaerohalosphaeraceae bacterium]